MAHEAPLSGTVRDGSHRESRAPGTDGEQPQRGGRSLRTRSSALLAGVAAGLASSFVPTSYDEAFWLGIVRLVEGGRTLYEGALDNKSPVLYGLVWLIDALPGPFVLWRSLLVGSLLAAFFWSLARLIDRQDHEPSWVTVHLAGLSFLLAEGSLTTELVSVTLLALALAWKGAGKAAWTALLLLAAIAFDPRTVLLIPGLVLLLRTRQPVKQRRILYLALVAGILTASTLVFAVPDLRYGVIELNLTSRSDLDAVIRRLPSAWILPAAGFLPLLLARGRAKPWQGRWVLLAGAIAIPLVSLLPIPHYAIYLTLAFALYAEPRRRPLSGTIAVTLVLLAWAPLSIRAVSTTAAHRDAQRVAEQVAGILDATLQDDQTYVVFGALPHLVARLPERYTLRSSTSLYLGLPTSRSDAHRREMSGLLENATAVVDGGGLSVPRPLVFAEQREIYDLFQRYLRDFPCQVRTEGRAVVWLRDSACPSLAS